MTSSVEGLETGFHARSNSVKEITHTKPTEAALRAAKEEGNTEQDVCIRGK